MPSTPADAAAALARENEELRHRLLEAEELITAIRSGAVDALAVQGADGPQIYTLQSADQGYRTLIEEMNEGALLLSQDATILYCNACLAGWLGRALEEVIGHAFSQFIPPSFHSYWQDLVAQGWAGTGKGELPLQQAGGSLRPLLLSMSVLTFNDTPVLAVIATDLSAQKKIKAIQALVAEQNALIDSKNRELHEQEIARQVVEQAAAEARRTLEGIPQIAWTADPTGATTYLNRRWFDFSGQPQDPAAATQWQDAIFPPDAPATRAGWQHSLRTGEAFEQEFRLRDKAGVYRWMLGRALPSRDGAGRLMQWIGTCTDIHEQKLAQERIDQAQSLLQQNNEQLRRANVDLDNFIYTASHDLKAPINNIEGLLHALLAELPVPAQGADVPTILNMMQDSVDRFKRTIEHLTEVTKLQKENNQPVALVDLARLIREVVLDLAPLLHTVATELDIDVANCPPISFAEKNLRSVVYNLLSNAIKYHHPERQLRVRVRCRTAGQFLVLDVQDNGLGLNTENPQKLFAMFQRFHDHVEGSGIGLYMVKKILENAGGRIEVVSEVGRGATFSAYFQH